MSDDAQSQDEEVLHGFLGPHKELDREPWEELIGKLLRIEGAPDLFKKRCHESFQESRQRLEENREWQSYFDFIGPRLPGKGWELLPARRDFMPCWVPPELVGSTAPSVGGPLPFSPRRELSLADCYLILNLIHNASRRDGGRIYPSPDDNEFVQCFCLVQLGFLSDLRESDKVTLDVCVGRVKADLARLPNTTVETERATTAVATSAPMEQITLRARVAAFMADRAEKLKKLPTLKEVFATFPGELGARSSFYKNNPWYKDLRAGTLAAIQRDAPRKGHRNAIEDGGNPDAMVEAPDYHQDEDE